MSSCSTGELRQTCVHDLQLLKTARVEKGHLIFDLETLLFPLSFNKHAARVQISTVIYSHIAPFFHIYIFEVCQDPTVGMHERQIKTSCEPGAQKQC